MDALFEVWSKSHPIQPMTTWEQAREEAFLAGADAAINRQQITIDTLELPLACPHCKKLLGYNVKDGEL